MKRHDKDDDLVSGPTLTEPGARDVLSSEDTLDRRGAGGGDDGVVVEPDDDCAELPVVARESYHVAQELRRGGMGRILAARDRRLRRPVAIKELLDGGVEADRPRFEREARITARLQHPNIVSVYEAGRWPTGEPFFAMKLVAGGRSLADVLVGATTLDQRLALLPHLLAVADALAYAHEQQVIHRDLKPANVLVGPFGETVVIDWGLGKDLSAGVSDEGATEGDGAATRPGTGEVGEAPLTQAGSLLGTPQYMPPEQAQRLPVDERGDVYAIGAMLYHLLAGTPPYRGNDPLEIVAWVAREPPVPLGRLQPEVPAELLTIVDKAMAREAADRYPTARELAADLRRFQTGQLVASHQYSRLSLMTRRVRPYLPTLLAVVLSVTAVAALLVVGSRRLERERQRAEEERERAALQADEATIAAARAALGKDPSLALARLKTLPAGSRRWGAARVIAADARERGVAQLVRGEGGVRQLALSPDGRTLALLHGRGGVTLRGGPEVGGDSSGEPRRLPTPSEAITLAFSPDGRWLATAGEDRVLRLWPLGPGAGTGEVGEPVALRGHRLAATTLAFSPDGQWLASTGPDRTLRLWDLTGGPARAGGGRSIPLGAESRIAFSPDGRVIATGGDDGVVTAWPVAGGAERRLGVGAAVRALAFAPDGARLAVGDEEGAVRLWRVDGVADAGTASSAAPSHRHPGAVAALAFASDGKTLVVAGGDRAVRLWSLGADGRVEVERLLARQDAPITQLALSPDGRALASGGRDGVVRLWDLADARRVSATPPRDLLGHVEPIRGLAFLPDGRRLASSDGHSARVWPVTERTGRPLADRPDGVQHLVVSPDGRAIAVAARTRGLTVYDPRGAIVLQVSDGSVNQLTFSRDSRRLATAEDEQRARVWDLATPTGAPRLLPHGAAVNQVAFSPDGKQLVTGAKDRLLRLWPVDGDATAAVVLADDEAIDQVAYSRDGRLLVAVATTGSGRIWEVTPGDRLHSFVSMRGAQLSPDGRLLAGGPDDGSVRLTELAGLEERTLGRHENLVVGSAWSPDGRHLATASRDRTAAVWEVSAGTARVLRGHTDWVTHVVFSPDGRTLATAGHDRTARLWDPDSGEGRSLPGNQGIVTWVPFFPDGRTVAVARATEVVLVSDDLPHDPAALRTWLDDATNATLDPTGQLAP